MSLPSFDARIGVAPPAPWKYSSSRSYHPLNGGEKPTAGRADTRGVAGAEGVEEVETEVPMYPPTVEYSGDGEAYATVVAGENEAQAPRDQFPQLVDRKSNDPIRRHIASWYTPGLDDDVTAKKLAPGTPVPSVAASTPASSPTSAVAPKSERHHDEVGAPAEVYFATMVATNSTSPPALPAVSTPSPVPTGLAPANARLPSCDGEAALPQALLEQQSLRNKDLKRLLMANMGPDFAKAGLRNDGVRTSFSVVNYSTIKQLTGLKRVPSALLISCLTAPDESFDWIDITMHPTATLSEYKGSLQEVLIELGMHRTMVEDSAEPMLLPQVTVTKSCHCLLLRYAIGVPPSSERQMDSFQDLTNRFTIFMTEKRIITVHRQHCAYVEALKVNWRGELLGEGEAAATGLRGMPYLLYFFVKEAIGTFTQAISKCIIEFDRYEAGLFAVQRRRSAMARDIYHIKRRASVYGRTLTLTQDAYSHMASAMQMSTTQVEYQEVMHDLAHVQSLAEELNDNADSVLQLLFQLSSYQVNELMRVLTQFSAFFIPLSFIASVYGMNFAHLPLLDDPYGGTYCALLMCVVAGFIYIWFKSNRFI